MRDAKQREPARVAPRRAAAAVELALLLPVLTFLLVISADFARLYYHFVTITNCARNGALWLCDPVAQATSKYASVDAAARADATNLDASKLTVSSKTGIDASSNPYVEVTVIYQFPLITTYLGFGTQTLSRTVRMRSAPITPS
ncbi:MAG TPA: TadE/TadG family type IV pilus assembly protein [Gemmataceae bacterium]|nr:TadE/TadG family type IV pilus assembly protein [Gemmataceae bacterium]